MSLFGNILEKLGVGGGAATGHPPPPSTAPPPTTGKIEPKTTYILRVGDVVLEAGIYKK